MSAPRLMSLFRVVGTKACVVRSASRGFPPSPIVTYSCTRVFFSAGYTCDVIEEAQVYTQHRSGEEVNLDDVKLAIHALLQNQFVKPPTADTMHQFAHSLNRVPLPPLNNRPGIHVPQDDNLLSANYEYFPREEPLVDPDAIDDDDGGEANAAGGGGVAARAEAAAAEPTEMREGGVEGFKVKRAKK